MPQVPIYDWLSDGDVFGCGTKVEFDHWTNEGVNPKDAQLGAVIGFEPPYMDENRAALWGRS